MSKDIVSKKDQVLQLVSDKDYKKALSITKDFVIDFTKEERRILQIAYETLTGNGSMYTMLSIDTDEMIEKAIVLLNDFVERKTKK